MALDKEGLEVLQRGFESNSTAYLSADGVDIVFQTKIINVSKDHVVLSNSVPPSYITAVSKSKSVHLQSQMARFGAEGVFSDGLNIIFPLDGLTMIEETRESKRFPFDPEERVVCEFLNPYDKTTRLTKNVMDMSATGLSVRTSFPSRLFLPDTQFEEVKINIDGEPYTKTSARVVYTRKLMGFDGRIRVQVGLQITK